ncbi:glycerophosphodiester phosphodiesterase [Ferrovibrio sp. MS7]|uniref:glycerophosphodiester phosphodiesterase n=1 Tax=Ferrovibrio plantarum TaxID=3119164 RepID=UPI0031346C04
MTEAPPKWLLKTPVAHRGLHDIAKGVPENSRLAFQHAIDNGYAIELDVRITGDGQVVVFHDAVLDRLCGKSGRVSEMSLAALKRETILGTTETVPSLNDVLDLVQGRVPLLVEIKKDNADPAGALEQAVANMLRHYPGPVAVQSFSPRTVAWFRDHAPQFVRGQIACALAEMGKNLNWYQKLGLRWMLNRFHGEPMFLAYDVNDLPAPLTARYRAHNLPVISWTVRSKEQRARAAAHADNIIFEELSTK